MRALRKSRGQAFALRGGIIGEARIVERAFGVGPWALTEAIAQLQDHLTRNHEVTSRTEPPGLPSRIAPLVRCHRRRAAADRYRGAGTRRLEHNGDLHLRDRR